MTNVQSCQLKQSHAHSARSADVNFGRFTERCTPIWWRSARIKPECSAAPKQPENGTDERRNNRPEPQLINKRQPSIYQSDLHLREAQSDRRLTRVTLEFKQSLCRCRAGSEEQEPGSFNRL